MAFDGGVAGSIKLSDGAFLERVCKRLRNESVAFAQLERDVLHEVESLGGGVEDVLVPLRALIGRVAWETYRMGHTEGTVKALSRAQSVMPPL